MEWISVKDRLPELREEIGYVWDGKNIRNDVYYDHFEKKWQYQNRNEYIMPAKNVTHWIAYPKKPT